MVYDRRAEVGARFHGDFQGLDNWSTKGDVLDELESYGIEPSFKFAPFNEAVMYGPDGREYVCRSSRPLWYLVQRGTTPGTLDQALKQQALDADVELKLGTTVKDLPEGGIVAYGPRRVDGIAIGYTFETDMSDGAFAVSSNALAPNGYAYLLIWGGRATLATCMFSDFGNGLEYLERSVDFFRARAGLKWRNETRFGGDANVETRPKLQRGQTLFAGEASGLQDFLLGFGMRYAMVSGHFAGAALQNGDPDSYRRLYRERLWSHTKAGAVNRFLRTLAGSRGYEVLIKRVAKSKDPRELLRRYYSSRWWTHALYPLATVDSRFRRTGVAIDDWWDRT